MTNTLQAAGKWDQFKGELKKAYGQLTDQELEYGAKGQWDKLKGWAKETLGNAEEQKSFNDRIDAYQQGLNDANATDTDTCGCGSKHGKSAA